MPLHRLRAALPALVVAVVLVAAASLVVGSNPIPLPRTVDVLLHPDASTASAVVNGLRVPRTILAALAGAALGVAGVLMQTHTRNPLADPGLFGVSAGAALAVVAGVYWLQVDSQVELVLLALIGAGLASVVVFSIASAGATALGPVPLALAGAAVSELLGALTTFVVLSDQRTLDVYRRWVVGSVAGRGTDVILAVLPVLLLGFALVATQVRSLDALALGGDLAAGLGEHPLRARISGLLAITLLTGAATAAAGPIGFLGLTVPHLGRALVGPGHAALLPVSALLGAALLTGADVVGRVIGGGNEIQVGVVLALLGAPVFVAVARRRSLVAL